ncbi:hypothetical protein V441_33390 [Pseudomonas aeruginosa DHS29]|nr:hypothetical protein DPADHS01_17815 [Pseudomonas aeruginosa DHS01]ESZ78933.1 hypothetical protein V441_33390 [Pseudomonas aeruginosa DHS29]
MGSLLLLMKLTKNHSAQARMDLRQMFVLLPSPPRIDHSAVFIFGSFARVFVAQFRTGLSDCC